MKLQVGFVAGWRDLDPRTDEVRDPNPADSRKPLGRAAGRKGDLSDKCREKSTDPFTLY